MRLFNIRKGNNVKCNFNPGVRKDQGKSNASCLQHKTSLLLVLKLRQTPA